MSLGIALWLGRRDQHMHNGERGGGKRDVLESSHRELIRRVAFERSKSRSWNSTRQSYAAATSEETDQGRLGPKRT